MPLPACFYDRSSRGYLYPYVIPLAALAARWEALFGTSTVHLCQACLRRYAADVMALLDDLEGRAEAFERSRGAAA